MIEILLGLVLAGAVVWWLEKRVFGPLDAQLKRDMAEWQRKRDEQVPK